MRLKKPVWGVVLLFLLLLASPAVAEVDMQVTRSLNLDQAPLAMEVAADGSYIYVLTHEGKLQIYDATGRLDDTLEVGTHIDGIETGPNVNRLYLTSSSRKTVDIVNLTFVKNIPIEGSPFKGKADAPVALVVFSDFQ